MRLPCPVRPAASLSLAVLLAAGSAGCAGTAPAALGTAAPVADVPLDPVPARAITGEWTGVYFVYPSAYVLTLTLTEGPSGGLVGESWFRQLEEPRVGTRVEGRVAVRGTWSPAARSFEIVPAEWIEQPRGMTARNLLSLHGVYDATRPAMAGVMLPVGAQGRAEPIHFTLARGGGAEALVDAMERAAARDQAGFHPGRLGLGGPSAEEVRAWAAQFSQQFPDIDPYRTEHGRLFSLAVNLFRDEHFVPHFGKGFDQMPIPEKESVARTIREMSDRRYVAFARSFASTGTGGRPQITNGVLAMRVISAWKELQERRLATLPADVESFSQIAATEAAAETSLQRFWPGDRTAFADAVRAGRERVADPVLMARAQAAVASAEGYAGARTLARWEQGQREILRWAAADTRRRAAAMVQERLEQVLDPLVDEDGVPEESLGDGVVAVRRGNEWYATFMGRYGFAAGSPPVRREIQRLQELRPRHLAQAADAATAAIERLGDEDDVDEVVSSLLRVPGDRGTPAGRALVRAAEAQKAHIADLRRRRALGALAGLVAIVTDAAADQAEEEGDRLGTATWRYLRNNAIAMGIRGFQPELSDDQVWAATQFLISLADQELPSAGGVVASWNEERVLRAMREENPGFPWDAHLAGYLLEVGRTYGILP